MLQQVAKNKILIFIFLIAFFLRTFRLTELPVGFHADEVRVAWNAYSILQTGNDDRGNAGAFYYNTFGDFRPTGIFYLTLPSIAIFGPTIFATRLPSALIGALTAIALFYLTIAITKNKNISLFASFFISILPWHISSSRSTSEVVIALFFALCGLVYIYKKKYFWSFILFTISMLFYHSARVVIPLFVLASFWHTKQQKTLFVFLGVTFLSMILLLNPPALERFTQVSLTRNTDVLGQHSEFVAIDTRLEDILFHNRPAFFLKKVLDEYTKYFSTSFLTNESVLPTRYATSAGLLSYTALFFILLGIVHSLKERKHALVFLLLAASVIPAAMTSEDSPNMHRALFMTPFLAIFAGIGFASLERKKLVSSALLIIFCIQVFSFWHAYRKHSPELTAASRNNGAFEVINHLDSIDQSAKEIYLSNEPDDLYPWFAIHHKLDPKEFNPIAITREKGEWKYKNYIFTQRRCPSDYVLTQPNDKNTIVVDRGEMCGVEQKLKDGIFGEVIHEIKHPDGTVAFTVWRGKEK